MNKKYTLHTDVDDSREATTDAISRLAEVVTLILLLDVLHHQRSVDHFHIGLDIGVEVLIIFWFVSRSFLPTNLRFGESIGLAIHFSIASLSKLFVCWLNCPSWRH